METKEVHCNTHGLQGFGFLCIHLAGSAKGYSLGFHEQQKEDEHDAPLAWCGACEERWTTTQTDADQDKWTDDCDFKVICATCWSEIKAYTTCPSDAY